MKENRSQDVWMRAQTHFYGTEGIRAEGSEAGFGLA